MPLSAFGIARSCLVAVAGALALLAGADPAAAAGGGSVSVGRPFADPGPDAKFTVGEPIRFSCTGKYRPGKDANDEPYVGFLWQWGDGSKDTLSVNYPGTAAQTDEQTHTFAVGGTFTVRCYAYHGLSPFGRLLIHEDATVKVRVRCPGEDPGPKKCKPGEFDAFHGFWVPTPDLLTSHPEIKNLQLSIFNDLKGKPRAVVTYTGRRDQNVILPFKMKTPTYEFVQFGEQIDESLSFATDATHDVEGGGTVDVGFSAQISYTSDRAYRTLALFLEELPALGEKSSERSGRIGIAFVLQSRLESTTANICTTVGASKEVVRAGDQFVVSTLIANEGAACLPGRRLLLNVEVEGGTILSAEGVRMISSDLGGENAVFTVGALGEGKGNKTATARGTMYIFADANAAVVRIQVSVLDVGALQDQLFSVTTPPDRVLCIPVVAKKP